MADNKILQFPKFDRLRENSAAPPLPPGSDKVKLIRPRATTIVKSAPPSPVNVVALPPKPITDNEGMHWKSAVDVLKELINDIEHGRLQPPELIYIAMQTRHPERPELVQRPAYSWAPEDLKIQARLLMMGLLTHHAQSL